MSDIESIYDYNYSQINKNWLKIFNNIGSEMLLSLKKYIVDKYNRDPNTHPSINNIFNPFKLTDPYDVKIVILSHACDSHSSGLAYSGDSQSKAVLNIQNELQREYSDIINYTININPTFEKLARQGVFMPNIHFFYGKSIEPQFISIFWENIFNFLERLGNIIWFAWGDNETYINKILKVSEDNLNKKKPDDKIIVRTNVKIRDNNPYGRSFKGSGCFILANHYLKQFHREPINWLDI